MIHITRETKVEQAIARDIGTYTLEQIADRHGYSLKEVAAAMKRLSDAESPNGKS